jgi:hypothetical protein
MRNRREWAIEIVLWVFALFLAWVFLRQGVAKFSDSSGWARAFRVGRHVLVSVGKHSLLNYDGEGHFRRNRRGDVTHFIYYEFGRRMGVARTMTA